MDFGEATYTNSLNNVSDPVLIIKSQRYVGFSYRFHKKNLSQYACASCKILGKTRVVTVKNGSDNSHNADNSLNVPPPGYAPQGYPSTSRDPGYAPQGYPSTSRDPGYAPQGYPSTSRDPVVLGVQT